MLEIIGDLWALLITLLISCWNILESALSLLIIDDPFWRGVELTIVVLLVWKNRRELIDLIDKIPLLGGLLSKVLNLSNDASEYVLGTAHTLWEKIRSNTWDRLVKAILDTDKDLRD